MILRDLFMAGSSRIICGRSRLNTLDIEGIYQDGKWEIVAVRTDKTAFVSQYGRDFYMPGRPVLRSSNTFYGVGSFTDDTDMEKLMAEALSKPLDAAKVIPELAAYLQTAPGLMVLDMEIQFEGALRIVHGLRLHCSKDGTKFSDKGWLASQRTINSVEGLNIEVLSDDFDLTLRIFGYTAERPVFSPTSHNPFRYTVAVYHGESYDHMIARKTTLQLQVDAQEISQRLWERTLNGNGDGRFERIEQQAKLLGI